MKQLRVSMVLVAVASLASAQVTDPAGGGQPLSRGQPALALTQLISTVGTFPSMSSGDSASLAFVRTFAGSFTPSGSMMCDGSLLPLQQNQALFALIGTTYGGNGTSNFAVPDLGGRFMSGVGTGPGLPAYATGDDFGAEDNTLTLLTMPAHQHLMADGGVTGVTGGGQLLELTAPTLTLTPWVAVDGNYPTTSGVTDLTFIGEIRWFAGNFVPDNWVPCDGRLLSVSTYSAAFSVFGTTFGGDGVNTFAVPDLRGRVPVGTGTGPGLQPVALGETWGSPYVSLTSAQLATHLHGITGDAPTALAGQSLAIDARQPSLGITWLIATQGIFPSQSGGSPFNSSTPTMAEVVGFVGNFAPRGWATASGQLMAINQNQALFALLGTSYGGDGQTTFALPDLRGRTPIGTNALTGTYVGAQLGAETRTLTISNLPPHVHTYTPAPVFDAGVPDAGVPDAGVPDAGDVDAGDVDAGEVDAGEVDAGEVDAGEVDAGEVDAGEVDAGEVDAGEVDAGEVDAGEVDAGELDAGELDAGELADAGVTNDAGVAMDAGVSTDGGTRPDGGTDAPDGQMGCGCSTDGSSANFLGAMLLMLLGMRRRTR